MLHKYLFFCMLLLLSATAMATGQEGNVMLYRGEKWSLLAYPLYCDTALYKKVMAALPKDRGRSTANWDGYLSHWSVEDGMLVLDSVSYRGTHKDIRVSMDKNRFGEIFKAYRRGGKVVASWVTATLRLGKGDIVYYEHAGFDRYYEEEALLKVVGGRVTDVQTNRNRVFPGLQYQNIVYSGTVEKYLPLGLLPELQGRKVMVKVNLTANPFSQVPDSCVVKVVRVLPDSLTQEEQKHVETVVSQAFRAIYPLKMYEVEGKRFFFRKGSVYFLLRGEYAKRGLVYEECEEMPDFPGGWEAYFHWVAENMQWPDVARERGGQREVNIKCIVEPDGTLSSPMLVRKTDPSLEKEALRVFHRMPRWIVGKHAGKPVRCVVTLPFRF